MPSGGGAGGFPSGFTNASPGGTTFSFSSGFPGAGGPGGFRPSAAEDIFRAFFGSNNPFAAGGDFMDTDEGPSMGGMPSGFFSNMGGIPRKT